jgi:ABC-type proline/glycine betaine transport system permease subunit
MALDLDAVVAEFFSIILALPSVALYLLQCAVIIRHWKKDFNGSFFKLFLVSALNVNIVNLF